MNFAEAAKKESSWTTTENGAKALNTTGNACVDFFGIIGALRNADEVRICTLFEEAYKENPDYATKIMFYGRDIREGLGERKVFRTLLRYCAEHHSNVVRNNIESIGEYGRFDDWYSLVDTSMEEDMWEAMRTQLSIDWERMEHGQPISLLAKWIKTPDASSKNTRKLGIKTALKMNKTVKDFKRDLRKFRKYLDVTEVKMSANKWNEIEFSSVPSRAMKNYRNAFQVHDGDRFADYISKVNEGKEKINASTLYPYDLVETYLSNSFWRGISIHEENPVVEAQWKALPNYVEPGTNAIVMADTSGSMCGRPINSALGLAIYFAEHNTGAYHNLFMSFSCEPNIHKIKGDTLCQKLNSIDTTDWQMNTDLKKAFKKVLDIAIENNVPKEEMVKSIIVISDMEIDYCGNKDWTFYDKMKAKFEKKGYDIPNIIFWNVNSRHDVFHADANRKGVQLVSGQSTTVFKQLVDSIGMTPVELMEKVILSDRYSRIRAD